MKTKLKGFTLVELIVVMAIMSILMVAIMNMWKPVRDTYVDSTQYEAQRTVQNGVVQYITESVRFATDMGIYTSDKVSSVSNAVDKFADEYISVNAITDTNDQSRAKEAIQRSAEVLIIDNSDYSFNGKDWYGRILRRKFIADSSVSNVNYPYKTKKISNDAEDVSKSECRMALGAAYYGENNYSISLDITDKSKGMLGVSVTSTRNSKRDISNAGKETDLTNNITNGAALCRNLAGSGDHGITNSGMFDIRDSSPNLLCSTTTTGTSPNTRTKVNSTTKGQKTYIVFINNEIDYTTPTT